MGYQYDTIGQTSCGSATLQLGVGYAQTAPGGPMDKGLPCHSMRGLGGRQASLSKFDESLGRTGRLGQEPGVGHKQPPNSATLSRWLIVSLRKSGNQTIGF